MFGNLGAAELVLIAAVAALLMGMVAMPRRAPVAAAATAGQQAGRRRYNERLFGAASR